MTPSRKNRLDTRSLLDEMEVTVQVDKVVPRNGFANHEAGRVTLFLKLTAQLIVGSVEML